MFCSDEERKEGRRRETRAREERSKQRSALRHFDLRSTQTATHPADQLLGGVDSELEGSPSSRLSWNRDLAPVDAEGRGGSDGESEVRCFERE